MHAKVTLKEKVRCVGELLSSKEPFITDIVKKYGGLEEYPDPTTYLAGALASCTLSVIALKADRLKVNIEGIEVMVDLEFSPQHLITKFCIDVVCPQKLSDDVTKELEAASYKCPVLKSLDPAVSKEHTFKWGR